MNKRVLYIDDDDDDIDLFRQLFEQYEDAPILNIASNGEEAVNFLTNSKSSLPNFIVVDINMPKMNGIEFLKWIKADVDLKNIEMLLMSTSTDPLYEQLANNHGVPYYQKPVRMIDLKKLVNNIIKYCKAL